MNGLRHLFSAYFHQDWLLEHETPEAVVREFVSSEPSRTVRQSLSDLEDLITSRPGEEEARERCQRMGSFYEPAGHGQTYLEWLESLRSWLRDEIGTDV